MKRNEVAKDDMTLVNTKTLSSMAYTETTKESYLKWRE